MFNLLQSRNTAHKMRDKPLQFEQTALSMRTLTPPKKLQKRLTL
uniref:Uncharacterized protein n=1 Tax=Tetranychus urticae TaxID=32264 RepID=T1K8T4_TETUR